MTNWILMVARDLSHMLGKAAGLALKRDYCMVCCAPVVPPSLIYCSFHQKLHMEGR